MTFNKNKLKGSSSKQFASQVVEYAFGAESKQIEDIISSVPFKLKQLGNDLEVIGSENDNLDYRKELNEKMIKIGQSIREVKTLIDEFHSLQVPYDQEKVLKDKHEAFANSYQLQGIKFQAIKKQIDDKSKLFQELGSRRRPSYKKQHYGGGYSAVSQDEESHSAYAPVHGHEQQQVQCQELSHEHKEGIALKHETKFQEAVINENQENLDLIEGMMTDLTDIQASTKTELVKQTEDLIKIVDNTDVVVENVELAHVEIVKAEKHQSGTGKCVIWIVVAVIVCVTALVLIIVLT